MERHENENVLPEEEEEVTRKKERKTAIAWTGSFENDDDVKKKKKKKKKKREQERWGGVGGNERVTSRARPADAALPPSPSLSRLRFRGGRYESNFVFFIFIRTFIY